MKEEMTPEEIAAREAEEKAAINAELAADDAELKAAGINLDGYSFRDPDTGFMDSDEIPSGEERMATFERLWGKKMPLID